jgi:hypothetical protein
MVCDGISATDLEFDPESLFGLGMFKADIRAWTVPDEPFEFFSEDALLEAPAPTERALRNKSLLQELSQAPHATSGS